MNVKSSFDDATPLHTAAKHNCADATKVLLHHGADVTDVLTNGHIALHVASRRGHLKLVEVKCFIGILQVN